MKPLLLRLLLLLNLPTYITAECACVTVDSWENLKNTIESSSANTNTALLRLCPFEVTKLNSEEGIIIPHSDIHIMCAKDTREDECVINGTGPTGSNVSKNYDAIIIPDLDNVWLQGLTFRHAKKGAIKAHGQNIQIIDSVFENCQSPPEYTGAVVEIVAGSTATIIDSTFRENEGGAIQSHGFLTVTHCDFIDNISTPVWISNDETESRGGGVGGAIMNGSGGYLMVYGSRFDGNVSDKNGPAIWSYTDDALDLGSNCGENNRIIDFRQLILGNDDTDETVLGYCDGIYYKHTSSNKGNLCATFGGACAS